jgi:hypothetical protein
MLASVFKLNGKCHDLRRCNQWQLYRRCHCSTISVNLGKDVSVSVIDIDSKFAGVIDTGGAPHVRHT